VLLPLEAGEVFWFVFVFWNSFFSTGKVWQFTRTSKRSVVTLVWDAQNDTAAVSALRASSPTQMGNDPFHTTMCAHMKDAVLILLLIRDEAFTQEQTEHSLNLLSPSVFSLFSGNHTNTRYLCFILPFLCTPPSTW
jgi:hypothetical protein